MVGKIREMQEEAWLYRSIHTLEVLMVACDGRNRVLGSNRCKTSKSFIPIYFQRTVYEVAAENKEVGCRVLLDNVG